ncbi:efflux RND transporter periplasmic adaptor subunit [Gammaproteobacteria bacterium]|nr:efflux RND transporter periplasmic adaptor subunit [Gammaproteobacteria bacterium]MDA9010856.1 efflux RND transporter periplasmic adaptor subunit [Gammaproteobacteria bacterium]MDA9118171.1 efflux RND transporter periplasmic adaptor subunit [Gammaproteobacteria bacterium]MDA9842190.1 efflux RND transporter periplasmic adaptor subunit [Gammaproteobacteria bacterium]MDB4591749.1 efflux RND transporter periplasmic adaptor subunit [Gammaproteobacteria bacterium]|tara:strand:+ start:202 stop:1425 length:1224 start_codon:yes stop_codon:yes gene_type:complete
MNKINKKQLVLLGIIVIVVAYFSLSPKNEPKQDEALANFYKKDEVSPKKLFVSIEASGLIEAISSVEIKSKASGEILFLGAEVGDFVSKGSMLSQIDQRTPKNILDQSKSDLTASNVRLENAEAQFNRGKELHDKGSISDKDFEDIQENFAQAKSTLVRTQVTYENAKIALDDTVVRSPVSGTVISRPVEVGQVISSPTQAVGGGTVLMTMADLSKVRVRALVDEIDVGKVSIGQKVSIKVAAYRDKEFFGTVSKIEPKARVEQNVTTFPVLIDIDNKENLLLLGMNTDVVIDVLNKEVALSTPSMSLRTRKDIYSAASIINMPKESIDKFLEDQVTGENFNKFIVIKDSLRGPLLTWVEIGVSDLANVEIVDGLNQGDTIYIMPSKSLFDYQKRFKERVNASFSFG